MIDLRLGRWQDALSGVEVDAVICDPPYGGRTHEGARSVGAAAEGITYARWSPAEVAEFVSSWAPRTKRWIVALTSHDLIPAYEAAYQAAGWLSFAPVACVLSGMGVRIQGDGPASWTVYAMVARPRTKAAAAWRSLPGAYWGPTGAGGDGRNKPAWLDHALVRDYSDAGDLVADPCAGHGGILTAAAGLDRRAIGAEVLPEVHAVAARRLGRGQQRDLFA